MGKAALPLVFQTEDRETSVYRGPGNVHQLMHELDLESSLPDLGASSQCTMDLVSSCIVVQCTVDAPILSILKLVVSVDSGEGRCEARTVSC